MDLKQKTSRRKHIDQETFRQIVRKHSNAVYAVAYSKLGDFHMAEDIAQEVFLKAHKQLHTLRERDKLGNWLIAITTRQCVDFLRSKMGKQKDTPLASIPDSASDSNVLDEVLQQETKDEVWRALFTLDEEKRTPIILFHLGSYNLSEISQLLNISVKAVDSRLRRARKLLKKELVHMLDKQLSNKKLGAEFERKVVRDPAGYDLEDHREAAISMACYKGSKWDGVDMRDSHLTHVNFVGSTFNHIYFSNVLIDGLQWGGSVFKNIMRPSAEKSHLTAEPGTQDWVNVEPVQFIQCDLSTATFVDCNLSHMEISNCNLEGARINGILISELLALAEQHKNE